MKDCDISGTTHRIDSISYGALQFTFPALTINLNDNLSICNSIQDLTTKDNIPLPLIIGNKKQNKHITSNTTAPTPYLTFASIFIAGREKVYMFSGITLFSSHFLKPAHENTCPTPPRHSY